MLAVTLSEPVALYERHFGQTRATGWIEAGETISLDATTPGADRIESMVGEPAGFERIGTEQGPTYIRRADAVRLRRRGRQ